MSRRPRRYPITTQGTLFGPDGLDQGKRLRAGAFARMYATNRLWQAAAVDVIFALPRGWRGKGEDMRIMIEAGIGGPPPHCSTNIYGMVVLRAIELGLVTRTGMRQPMTLDRSHARMTDVYRRL